MRGWSHRVSHLIRLATWPVFLVGLVALGQNVIECAQPSPLIGHPAPPFSLPVVAGEGAAERDRVSLEALRGQVVLLDFWASWCPACRASIPILSRIAARYRDRGLVTLGINVEADRTPEFVARAHRALGAGFPSLHDASWSVQRAYGIRSLPTIVVLDRQGVVRRFDVGMSSESELDARVRELLDAPP
jgi:thiol-disulfide isomerase/thioredoxin